jgi:hypothetical protein
MENRQQQILEEIKAMLVSLRNQVDELEARLAELQIEDLPAPEEPQVALDEEDAMEVSLDIMEMDFTPEPEVTPEPEAAPVPEEPLLSEDLPADDDLPFFDEPVETVEDLPAPVEPAAPVAVIDAMTARQAWRTDMPGTPVRDIRSAISLNDRILFINWLFNEDPMAFQETLTSLNSMTSFDEAVNFVVARHPEWDLESDTVYRFMMALRRRLQ